jgi:hypothetical protein
MIELDNPPLAVTLVVIFVYVAPFLYSFFVDHFDKKSPQIRN